MHGAAVAALQRGRHALLRGERFTKGFPAVVDAFGLALQAQRAR